MAAHSYPPRQAPLEVNEIDELIRRYGGSTLALGTSLAEIQQSKQKMDSKSYIHYLSQNNGRLAAEVAFYRQCYTDSKVFEENISYLAQELLHECIISLLSHPDTEKMRGISTEINVKLEDVRERQSKALNAFAAKYRDSNCEVQPRA
jgi:hypothetical protein